MSPGAVSPSSHAALPEGVPLPVAPTGWFAVGPSGDLPVGGVEPLWVFARELVLYRDEGGAARVLDAHCRHLGAHLGYGGRVEGDGIRCPFHAWRWGPDGICTDIPYARHVPKGAQVGAWPVCEANGFVYVWHDARGEPPAGEVPSIAATARGGWTEAAHRRWKVRGGWVDFSQLPVSPDAPVELTALGPGLACLRTPGGEHAQASLHATPIDAGRSDVRLVTFQRGGASEEASRRELEQLVDWSETLATILDHRETPPAASG